MVCLLNIYEEIFYSGLFVKHENIPCVTTIDVIQLYFCCYGENFS